MIVYPRSHHYRAHTEKSTKTLKQKLNIKK